MSDRKFYETTILCTVLSDRDPSGMSLEDIVREAETGGFVMDYSMAKPLSVTPKHMAQALENARSYAGFFDLEDEE